MSAFRAPIWSSGFRPFYLLGAVFGPLAMAHLLALALAGPVGEAAALHHGHEMIFGFAGAMCAGFVLTALPSWAGTPEIAGKPLAGLVLAWIAGRLAVLFADHLPPGVVAAADCALYLLLTAMVAPGLMRGRDPRYLAIIPILLGLTIGNGLYHGGLAAGRADIAHLGLRFAIAWQTVLYTIASGALTHIFTETALRDRDPAFALPFRFNLEFAVLGATLASGTLWTFLPGSAASALFAALAAALHLVRFARWRTRKILDVPLVWILHLAYAFLILSFALRALADGARLVPESAALHAFTAGALSLTIVGIMTRVALKHTGRPLHPPPVMVVAFGAMAGASVLRFLAAETEQTALIVLSALAWSLPFVLYLIAHGRALIAPSLPREYKAPTPPPS
ncbi:MAG: NnrS family protein [Alphaproteobacteria bacterium]|nr:NnrS family protein [Alphaproteobacteria bacterium]